MMISLLSGETDMIFPVAKLTILEWVLSGGDGISDRITIDDKASLYSGIINKIKMYEDFDLDTINRSLDEPITPELTSSEHQAYLHMQRTAVFDTFRGEWFIKIPWIDSDPNVEEGYQEFLNLDYTEKVPSKEKITKYPSYDLTSIPDFRLDKDSTKCRFVVNVSLPDVKDKTQSFNKLLMPGKNYASTNSGTYSKGYVPFYLGNARRSTSVDELQCRCLWISFSSLYFYVVSERNGQEGIKKKSQVASEVIDKRTYMDDVHIAQDTPEETIQTTLQILKILENGGFHVLMIKSSHPEFLSEIELRDQPILHRGEPVQDSDEGEPNDANPGKEAINCNLRVCSYSP
ncbi:unnamed protein product [Lepeophtheirus salmonis]|uniref:(salmon louse) hypothetical protein n=1 Tax=Lepeophtheirus salmonis TaxID=72036 RepID=A0A7R8CLT3_LEPSM|nr:unnamed protein product [Lepeophtheirus salmonis]CAF2855012.1 unnamed protein product [Lepeophtheirus salmonis]